MILNPAIMAQGGSGAVKMASGTITVSNRYNTTINFPVGFKPKCLIVYMPYVQDNTGYSNFMELTAEQYVFVKPGDSDVIQITKTATLLDNNGVSRRVTFTFTVTFSDSGVALTGSSSNSSAGDAYVDIGSDVQYWFAIG